MKMVPVGGGIFSSENSSRGVSVAMRPSPFAVEPEAFRAQTAIDRLLLSVLICPAFWGNSLAKCQSGAATMLAGYNLAFANLKCRCEPQINPEFSRRRLCSHPNSQIPRIQN